MRPLRILIAQTRTDLLAAALANAIELQPNEMVLLSGGVIDDGEIEAALVERPDAIFLIGDDESIERTSNDLIDRQLPLIVVRHDIGTGRTHIDSRQLPLTELLQVVRNVVERLPGEGTQPVLRYNVQVADEAAAKGKLRLVKAPQRDVQSLLRAVCRWIDAMLRRHLARRPTHDSDIAGFGMSLSTVKSLLECSDEHIIADDGDAEQAASQLREAMSREHHAPLARLGEVLSLSNVETGVLLLALAPELDPKYQRIFGYLNDDMTRRSPSLGLACALLGDALHVRTEIAMSEALARWRLLGFAVDGISPAESVLRFDPAIANWLLGDDNALLADARVVKLLRKRRWRGSHLLTSRADNELSKRLAELLTREVNEAEWLVLAGDDQAGWRALMESTSARAARRLLRIDLRALHGANVTDQEESLICLVRAAQLTNAVIVVDHDDDEDIPVLDRLVQLSKSVRLRHVIVTAQYATLVEALGTVPSRVLTRSSPDSQSRERMFVTAARSVDLSLDAADSTRLASLYPFGVDAIDSTARLARALSGSEPTAEQSRTCMARACKRIASPRLPRFARRLDPCFKIADVVVPEDRREQLKEIVVHARSAGQVLDGWGLRDQLPYGRGIGALFCGPSGTGKTMAAQAIAHALETDLYVVDIARVVSKYIGDTEKNLEAVFNDAERAGAVLLFDEADALFGRRSEVKDAHDRYANIEVAYLLQRMEMYSGIAILTTNLRQNLDPSFMRRLRFVIEFPKPDAAAREEIWQRCLDSKAPRAPDLDFRYLARRVELTGGNIRQITLRAAFAAAGDGEPIQMRHILAATRAELRKFGLSEADLELAA